MFIDRTDAGIQLAEKLKQSLPELSEAAKKSALLVVGLPRGGVPVALAVSQKFNCPLEIIVAKKLPFPGQPEYAIGAVSSDGVVVLNPDIEPDNKWKKYIELQRQELLQQTQEKERQFYQLAGREKSSFKDKIVIIIDDGVATGMTAIAALQSARQRGAACTIMAAPVMSCESYRQLRTHCDTVVAVSTPAKFLSVGQHYLNFNQTQDEEVVSALVNANTHPNL